MATISLIYMLAVGFGMLHKKKKKFRYELLFESKKHNSQEKITKHHKNYSIFAGIGRLHVIIKVVTNLMMRILKKKLRTCLVVAFMRLEQDRTFDLLKFS